MITIEELKKKALTKYPDFLLSYYNDSFLDFFPYIIPCNKGNPNDDFEKRSEELKVIHQNSKNNGKKSYKYDTDIVSTRNGKQTIITRIYFEDKLDYLSFINKKKEFEVLVEVSNIIFSDLHTSLSRDCLIRWFVKNHEIISNSNVEDGISFYWKNICLCANWLYKNNQSHLYLRTIPLEVHSKFIESNLSIIHSLISAEKLTKDNNFIKQHGLLEKPDFIRIRFLDEIECIKGFSPEELQLTTSNFLELPSALFMRNISSIYVIENEMVYLTFPQIKNAICIWGHGFTASQFTRFTWLNDYNLYYFGDLDEHGYEILSIFRTSFPRTKSFCMDMSTFNEFDRFRVKGESLKGNVPTNLTDDEMCVFSELKKDKQRNRLEQERISQAWIIKILHSNNL